MSNMDDIAVFKMNIADLSCSGFGTDLKTFAPIVPNNAVIYFNIFAKRWVALSRV